MKEHGGLNSELISKTIGLEVQNRLTQAKIFDPISKYVKVRDWNSEKLNNLIQSYIERNLAWDSITVINMEKRKEATRISKSIFNRSLNNVCLVQRLTKYKQILMNKNNIENNKLKTIQIN